MTNPDERDALLFETRGGMLRNILTLPVPRLAAEHHALVLQRVLDESGLSMREIAAWVVHAGGRDVLQRLQQQLGLAPEALRHSARMLREYGKHEQRLRVFRPAGCPCRAGAARLVVAEFLRRRLQLPRRAARSRLRDGMAPAPAS
jgi:hypothetical protein